MDNESVEIFVYLSESQNQIEACLDSLLKNTPDFLDIVLLGDHLPSPLCAHVLNFLNKYDRKKPIGLLANHIVQGYATTVHDKIKLSEKQAIAIVRDSILTEQWLEKMLQELVRQKVGAVSSDGCLLVEKEMFDEIKSFTSEEDLLSQIRQKKEVSRVKVSTCFALKALIDNGLKEEKNITVSPKTTLPPTVELSKTIKILSPSDLDENTGHWWGDHWVKQDLLRELQKLGWRPVEADKQATVSLTLCGAPLLSSSPIRAVWIYSHPSKSGALKEVLNRNNFDLVYTLSEKHLKIIQNVRQDAKILFPYAAKNYKRVNKKYTHDVVLLGNASKEMRVRCIKRLSNTNRFRLGIAGSAWRSMVGRHLKREEFLRDYWDNDKYSEFFGQAPLTIYAHHPDMKDMNFVAVRVLDIIASSDCLVLCDENHGLGELGLDMLPTFKSDLDIVGMVDHYLAHPQERQQKIEEARKVIRLRHTLELRAKQLSADLEEIASQKGIQLI